MKTLRTFALVLACVWVVLAAAAYLYAEDREIPPAIVMAVVPAFLVEAALYLTAGMEATRKRLEQLRRPVLAAWMTAAAPLPYTIYALAAGLWSWSSIAAIVGIGAIVSFWYVLLPRRPAVDFAFLGVLAALVLAKVFAGLYPSPMPRLRLDILGFTMLIRTALLAVLSLRRMEGIGFGFVPKRHEWLIALKLYALFLPIGLAVALATGFVAADVRPWSIRTILLALGTFVGFLWVVGLAEEFFFRGILQQLLARLMRSESGGWVVASILFGLAHLPFRDFPNYRFAALATVAGLFFGMAYRQARSIRAAMVTHALVVTTWRAVLG